MHSKCLYTTDIQIKHENVLSCPPCDAAYLSILVLFRKLKVIAMHVVIQTFIFKLGKVGANAVYTYWSNLEKSFFFSEMLAVMLTMLSLYL